MIDKRVMVVDDSPTIVKFVSFSLRAKGYKVVTACDGMDALEKLSSLKPEIDMLITDLNMPNIDGYELIESIRLNPKYTKLPIIILSSEEAQSDKELGIKVGASSYLVKPFRSQLLLNEVARYLPVEQSV